jgi:pyruvate carboxylase subunit B
MNIIHITSGKERYVMIDNNTWDMILGKARRLPGKLGKEITDPAEKLGNEFYSGNPQDAYPDELPTFREEMKKNIKKKSV